MRGSPAVLSVPALFVLALVLPDSQARAQRFGPPVPRWTFKAGAAIQAGAASDGKVVIFGTGSGEVVALALENGSERWRAKATGSVFSTPSVDHGSVIVSDMGATVRALDLTSGKVKWEAKVGDSTLTNRVGKSDASRFDPWDFFSASPLVDGDRVIVGAADGQLVAFDRASGRQLWRVTGAGPIRGRAARLGQLVVIGTLGGTVSAYSRANGKLAWTFKTKGNPDFPNGEVQGWIASHRADVLFGSRDYHLYRVNGADGTLRWAFPDPAWIIGAPVSSHDTLFVGSSDSHSVHAIDAAKGAAYWTVDVGAPVLGSPALWRDLVLVGTGENYSKTDHGYVVALDRSTGRERWRFKTEGNIVATPVVQGTDLLIGTQSGVFYDLRLTTPASGATPAPAQQSVRPAPAG